MRKIWSSILALVVTFGIFGGISVNAQDNIVIPEPSDKSTMSELDKEQLNPNSFPDDITETYSADIDSFEFIQAEEKVSSDNNKIASRASGMAQMRIYATASSEASSINLSGHAFLTVKNISSSNITVGGLSIAPNKSLTIGTWGNKSEHKGLWYNLEGYLASNAGAYSDCVSMQVTLSSSLLSTVSTNIKNGDKWTALTNCSSFATGVWNSVCSDKISAGTPNTPSSTKSSIMTYTSKYSLGLSIPYDYVVYYGNPATKSSTYK